ncbi:copper-binding protein [Ramlibacter sp.]|uniref:copper-binding protein n=1 Tax=Ramlibacter sp. TaxID=1917967 RepID=UPI00183C6F23|nr:copper-binding protein [Ramlibacter sp.]MBA2672439.1 copper-binding protein [Ramlibacter sp.]
MMRPLLAAALLACTAAGASAQPADSAAVPALVQTRAVVRSVFEEGGGKRLYIALKIAPGAKIPFSTITHRVLDRKLVQGLKPGDNVVFTAQRIDGENVVTALQRSAHCQRFEKCQ